MTGRPPRSCPVCGRHERRLIYRQRFLDGPLGNGYGVVVCSNCGAGFADGIASQEEMDGYYAERANYAYEGSGGNESPWDFRRFQSTVEQLSPFLRTRDARILDIGCATGGLLSLFKGRGFANVVGVDPSPACAEAAARLHSIRVRTAAIGQLQAWPERFDLVMLVGVLEHLGEVKSALRTAAQLLNPGGLLYCAVPDVTGLADCANAPFQQFSVEHVNFFSRGSLNRLMAECSLAGVETWRWTAEWREGVTEPIVAGLYTSGTAALAADESTGPALERYLAHSREGEKGMISVIEALRSSREPFLVWGAGTLARHLLAATDLAEANIIAFVDSNPGLQGKSLAGRPILSPGQVHGRPEPVLICSVAFEREISHAVREQHMLPNRLISLLSHSPD